MSLIPVTPSKADERLCPMEMARTGTPRCYGPACMAWRWVGDEREFRWSPEVPPGEGWEPSMITAERQMRSHQGLGWNRTIPEAERLGVCGMVPAAGREG